MRSSHFALAILLLESEKKIITPFLDCLTEVILRSDNAKGADKIFNNLLKKI